ncbi:MAG TPA: peptidoglycan-associated lipoprotein Pal [Acidobacteriota bacterium]|nr:peptidoglycan-associated lipoprotein Pal [Acidobacteriota bacterium]
MKNARHLLFLFLIVCIAFTFAACKKKKEIIEPPAPSTTPSGTMGEQQPSSERQTGEGPLTLDIFDEVNKQLQPVFFDYNKYDIRDDQVSSLQTNARVLKQNSTVSVLVEGHCDERGTEEYNQALGERRAQAAKDYLVSLGIAEARLSTLSYGETRPFAMGHNEDSWSLNRRAHFVAVRK